MKRSNFIYSICLMVLIFFSGNIAIAQKDIKLKDIWSSPVFYPKMVGGFHSMKDGNTYSVLEYGNINIYSYKTGKLIKTLAKSKKLGINISSYNFSQDETKILIPTETEKIYRRSSKSYYFVYDINKSELSTLASKSKNKQSLATFSPDGNKVAYTRDNNIFVTDLNTFKETQITKDGKINSIINGGTDWVYEEEFAITQGFEWSPNGDKIAYMRFDETDVPQFTLQYFGNLYPQNYNYKYPKAGEKNSIVEIYVYDLKTKENKKMDTGSETDIYLPRFQWTKNNDILSIQRLNRLQNKFDILLANSTTGKTNTLYSEENKYYVEITDNVTYLPNGKNFILTSEKDGFNHLYLYDMKGEEIRQLTKGNWDVISVDGYDAKRKSIFYQSAESSPLNRDIYSVNLKGKRTKLSSRKGTNKAQFSTTFNYYFNSWSDANTPFVYSINKYNGKEVRILEDNKQLIDNLKKFNLSKKEFFTIKDPSYKLPSGKEVELNAYSIKPSNFDENKKYPALLFVYGGPGSQQVTNAWGWNNYFWFQMLAEKGIIVYCIDNRGTGARGEEFKKMTYKELGKFEIEDQIVAAKQLAKLNYIDENHIAMFGWSFGGFMSTLAITKGSDIFSTAIAVAPVTNWRQYDNIYTERFMRTPQENPSGYDENSPINHVSKLKGDYLLIHGSADDNVHYQNALDLITALVDADKDFDLMVYPNKDHGIYGGNTRKHLYRKMTNFLLKSFKNKN
ncbi:MAG: S9 family peptidase [Bacteroidales bacterium]